MNHIHRIFPRAFLFLAVILLLSCCRQNAPQKSGQPKKQEQASAFSIQAPKVNTIITCGDSIKVELKENLKNIHVDSVAIVAGNKRITGKYNTASGMFWQSSGTRVGQVTLRIIAYYNDSLSESHATNIVVLSDLVPVKYKYSVIGKYPHDDKAYTQGLIFDNGILYESTGLERESSLRVVNIRSGKPEKMIALASEFFGEGIALFKDQIYQVTYKNQVGFVYDKKTLTQLRSFDYQFNEGWGLTTANDHLIMSDGSSQLYFIEPELFTQVDRIEVFDNKGMVDSLNELEYINEKILANIYGETYIVIIDPSTGKVTGEIDLRELMPEGSIGDYGKVLNGIAYNPQNKHLYITGKHWPVLYEIELSPAL